MPKVVVLGGGVAGLSAAHELVMRGFEVEVFEKNPVYFGGKARSIDYHHEGAYKNPLPGEHGFRFFPGFYKHVTDTMANIPDPSTNGRKTVFQNLVPTSRIMIARYGLPPIVTVASFPKNLSDIKLIVSDLTKNLETGLSKEEEHFFAERLWQLISSCRTRRNDEYERLGWWQYMQADRFSKAYQTLLVEGLTRTLVAAKAETASTKTGGDIFLQLLFTMADPSVNTDRVLDGPTNDRWLYVWRDFLLKKGVKLHQGTEAKEVVVENGKVQYVLVGKTGSNENIKAAGDFYILAMPVERAAPLINQDMLKVDGRLQYIKELAPSTAWMNGIQYYLTEDVPLNKGHIICSDSEWAVTIISQIQFWKNYDITQKGNGKVRGVISVDISDWTTPGKFTTNKCANQCTREEVHKEVWAQMKASLNHPVELLRDDMVIDYYLDRDIREKPTDQLTGEELENIEPLLVNKVNTWCLRPEADCYIPNLFFASDYVRTNTDLATMEGANEAARRAVNCVLDKASSPEEKCKVWPLKEPWCFLPMKWYDYFRYRAGLPWTPKAPFLLEGLTVVLSLVYLLLAVVSGFIKNKIIYPIVNAIPYSPHKKEVVFILGTMAATLLFALIDARFHLGYASASALAIGMYSIIALQALAWRDAFLKKMLVFALAAGITELIADNWLVNGIGSLFYPTEQLHIWASPFYMPLAWAVILIQVGYLGGLLGMRKSLAASMAISFFIGVVFIPVFESCAKYAGWWYYESSSKIFETPYYIILGEGLICTAIPLAFHKIVRKSWLAIVVMGIALGLWIYASYFIGYSIFGK
jgi:uncharacterized protein with NAD-binding domain and iron-sulfur cluster